MKKNVFLRVFVPTITLLFSIVLSLILLLAVKRAPDVAQETILEGKDGNPVTTVCISDLKEINTLPAANYTPNDYLIPDVEIQGEKFSFASDRAENRGTYTFIFLNLDPMDENFTEKADELEPFLQGDNNWHFTLYLPSVWSASTVYVNTVLFERTGEISDYNFIEYSEYQLKTETHSDGTRPLFIDLSFYPRRHTISPDRLDAATVVTIHYETHGNRIAGLSQTPIIGSDSAVRNAVSRDKNFLSTLSVISALVLASFIFVCLLKRNRPFLPQIFVLLGVFGVVSTPLALSNLSLYPYFWKSIQNLSYAFIPFSALFSMRIKSKKFSLKIVLVSIAALECICAAAIPFLPSSVALIVPKIYVVINLILSAIILIFVFLSAVFGKTHMALLLNPLLAGFLSFVSAIPNTFVFGMANPVYWICTLVLATTIAVGFQVFIRVERRNIYLTENLQAEVSRQTQNLREIIDERNSLLQFVSHDMKKPVLSIERFVNTLKRRETDKELLKTLDIISQKTDELRRNFTELSMYSKNNFIVEQSAPFEVGQVLEQSYGDLEPDCSANGIRLSLSSCKIDIFGKRNNLLSVINNLILNAVEHANCTEISVSAYKKRNLCFIKVSDNGKGLDTQKDIFRPYYSENASEDNVGLGLYLCKKTIEAMNGELSYEQNEQGLTFIISLPTIE